MHAPTPHRSRRLAPALTLGALLSGLALAGPVAAKDPAYVRDLPTAAEVAARFAVPDKEQSLGRQCAVLDMLWRGRLLPFADQGKPAVVEALGRYGEALTALRDRYAREVRPLDSADAKRRWDRMCANAPDGVHPATGKPDKSFPGLKPPVATAEVVAMFKPSVREAHQRALAEQARAATAQPAVASPQGAGFDALALGYVGTAVTLLGGLGVLALLLVQGLRMGHRLDASRGELRLSGKTYQLRHRVGTVVGQPGKTMETVVTGGGGGGGPSQAPVTVSVSSYTITHDSVFLRDDQGKIKHLQLRGWNLASQEGHRLVTAWLERQGKEVGDYVMIRNVTIDQGWTEKQLLRRLLAPHLLLGLALVAAATVLTGPVGLVVGLALLVWIHFRGKRKALAVSRDLQDWAEAVAGPEPAGQPG